MSELDILINKAYESQGSQKDINQVYTAFLRNRLYVPIEKMDDSMGLDTEEPFRPLFVHEQETHFMMCFDSLERLQEWAGSHIEEMSYVAILGREIIRGVGDNVHICLNYGTPYYKEFNPEEIVRLKLTVSKLEQFARKN